MKLFRLGLLRDTYHRPSSGRFGGLLEKDVGVGPPEPESADSGPAWMIGRGLPRFGSGEHTKWTALQNDLVSGFFEIGGGWENLVLNRQHRLQEADGSRSGE